MSFYGSTSTPSTQFTFYDSDDEGSTSSNCNGDRFFNLTTVLNTSIDSTDSDQMFCQQTTHETNIANRTVSQEVENRNHVKHIQFFSKMKNYHNDDVEIRDKKWSTASKPRRFFRTMHEYAQKVIGKGNTINMGKRGKLDTAKGCSSFDNITTILKSEPGVSDSDLSEINMMFGKCCLRSNEMTPSSSSRVVKTTQKYHTQLRAPVPIQETQSVQFSGNLLPPIRKQLKQPDKKNLNRQIENNDCDGMEIDTRPRVSLHNGEHMMLEERHERRPHILIKSSHKNDWLKKKSGYWNNDQAVISDWFTLLGKHNEMVAGGRKDNMKREDGSYGSRRNSVYLPVLKVQRKSVDNIHSLCRNRTLSVSKPVSPRFKRSI